MNALEFIKSNFPNYNINDETIIDILESYGKFKQEELLNSNSPKSYGRQFINHREAIHQTMNIHTPYGWIVETLFDENGVIMNGYDSDKEHAMKYLKPDTRYTISDILIDDFRTTIELKEIPNVRFNSVHFKNAFDLSWLIDEFNELEEPYRTQAINNIDINFYGGEEVNNPREALAAGFSWYNSPEGQEYWRGLVLELK